MVACPFQIPAYEYEDPLTPRVRKCSMCGDRVLATPGAVPACVEMCPPQCLTFGRRPELLELAHGRIDAHPDKYVDHVYGEHEVGGTSWMYVAGRPFTLLGFPELPAEATPHRTEPLQHAVFKHFVPPLGLFSLLLGISWLAKRREEPVAAVAGAAASGAASAGLVPAGDPPAARDHDPRPQPVRAAFLTRGVLALLFLATAAFVVTATRFVSGLSAVTHLDDRYPWGIWIAVDVAAGVALSAAGFTTAALAHIFHREDFEPIARPALLSALLGYTFVVFGLIVDLGRPYRLWHPVLPSMWSGHSVLFEVGMCVMAYLTVLYLEFLPVVLERVRGSLRFRGRFAGLRAPVEAALNGADRALRVAMPLLLVAGVVLSCLHQSSLGALMLLAPTKVSALWYTPVLPLLFLLSAIMVGYPVVMLESLLSARAFHRHPEMPLLSRLARIVPAFLGLYLVAKIADLAIRDQLGAALAFDVPSRALLAELLLGVALPLWLLASARRRGSPRVLLASALLVLGGVVLNRINVFLVAYRPPYADHPYFPSLGEISVTVGLFAALALVYRVIVTRLPVIPAEEKAEGPA
jgi:Ni/Fe-hydrogenase subunit HybB-like protein